MAWVLALEASRAAVLEMARAREAALWIAVAEMETALEMAQGVALGTVQGVAWGSVLGTTLETVVETELELAQARNTSRFSE